MAIKNNGLNGLNPRSYLGVEAASPPNFSSYDRDPTQQDYISFNVGDIWLNTTATETVWMLVRIYDNIGTWVKFGTPYFSVLNFITDAGTATQVASAINLFGDTTLDTDGSGNTVHINFSSTGWSGEGNLLIGGGTDAAWVGLTSTGGTVDITTSEHAINLEVISVGGLASLQADSGVATPVASNINVVGGTNIHTTAAVANTVTTVLNDDVVLAGTLTLLYTTSGVVSTNAVGLFDSSNGTDGQLLIGSTSTGIPAWANITSTGGTVTVTNDINTIDLSATGISQLPSSFLATQESTASNVLGLADYSLGSSVALTSSYDINNDLYLGDGAGSPAVFTAPQTGKYHLYFQIYIYGQNTPQEEWYTEIRIEATSRTVRNYAKLTSNQLTYGPDITREILVVLDMTAADTATFIANVVHTSANIDVLGDATIAKTYVYGYLVE